MIRLHSKPGAFVLLCASMGCGGSGGDNPAAVRARSLGAAFETACAAMEDGSVRCWGSGLFGSLADQKVVASSTPRLMPVSGARSTSSRLHFNCALLTTGGIQCWGQQPTGATPDGTKTILTTTLEPVAVPGISDAVALSSGELFSCAVRADKTVSCWGLNSEGQLGVDSPTGGTPATEPVVVPGVADVDHIASGAAHTCVASGSGKVLCWGLTDHGQGGPSKTPVILPAQEVPELSDVADVAAGYRSTCARKHDGTVWCWGVDLAPSENPPSIQKPTLVPGLADVQQVALGIVHACATLKDGTVWCWGTSTSGALGPAADATTKGSASPVQVTGITQATAVACGADFSCALVAGGSVWCWGSNRFGVLGRGGDIDGEGHPTPAQVAF